MKKLLIVGGIGAIIISPLPVYLAVMMFVKYGYDLFYVESADAYGSVWSLYFSIFAEFFIAILLASLTLFLFAGGITLIVQGCKKKPAIENNK